MLHCMSMRTLFESVGGPPLGKHCCVLCKKDDSAVSWQRHSEQETSGAPAALLADLQQFDREMNCSSELQLASSPANLVKLALLQACKPISLTLMSGTHPHCTGKTNSNCLYFLQRDITNATTVVPRQHTSPCMKAHAAWRNLHCLS